MAVYTLRSFRVSPDKGSFEEFSLSGSVQEYVQDVATACAAYLRGDEWSGLFDRVGEDPTEDIEEYRRRFLRHLAKLECKNPIQPHINSFEIDLGGRDWGEIVTMCGDNLTPKFLEIGFVEPTILVFIPQTPILEEWMMQDVDLAQEGLEVMDSHRVYIDSQEVILTKPDDLADLRGAYIRNFGLYAWDYLNYDWGLYHKPPQSFSDLIPYLRDIAHRPDHKISPVEMVVIPRLIVSRGWVDLYKEMFNSEWALLLLHLAVKQLQS